MAKKKYVSKHTGKKIDDVIEEVLKLESKTKYLFLQKEDEYGEMPALGFPYNIIDENNTEYLGYSKKGELVYPNNPNISITCYLNDDDTKVLLKNYSLEEEAACKIIYASTNPSGKLMLNIGGPFNISNDFYKLDGLKDTYTTFMIEAYPMMLIKNGRLDMLSINGNVIDGGRDITEDEITWYESKNNITEEQFRDLIQRLSDKLN